LRHDLGRCSEEWIFLKFLLLSMQQLCEGIGVNIDQYVSTTYLIEPLWLSLCDSRAAGTYLHSARSYLCITLMFKYWS